MIQIGKTIRTNKRLALSNLIIWVLGVVNFWFRMVNGKHYDNSRPCRRRSLDLTLSDSWQTTQ